jgi:hypothetical protein
MENGSSWNSTTRKHDRKTNTDQTMKKMERNIEDERHAKKEKE